MKKVLLVCPALPDDMPYLRQYLDIMELSSTLYDLTYISANEKDEKYLANYFSFNVTRSSLQNSIRKFCVYYRYSRFVIERLSSGNYTHVIIMGIASSVFLTSYLKRNFNSKYVYDIRDYSQVLRIPLFKNLNKELLAHSYMNVISSGGFKSWLPTTLEYTLCHNTTLVDLNHAINCSLNMISNDVIKILTIGQIRDMTANAYVIEQFSNDDKYELVFSGKGTTLESLENFVKERGYKNVKFTGRYKKEDEDAIVERTHFLNVCMESNITSDYLLSNRLYLATRLKKPLISFDGSYQADIINKYNLGVVVSRNDNLPSAIEKYINTFDQNLFLSGCQNFLDDVRRDLEEFHSKMNNFLE